MPQPHSAPFSIPAIRDFVPEKLKPWIIIVFVIIFQLSGGVYLAAVSEMVGSTALMQEDIMMAGHGADVRYHVPAQIPFYLQNIAAYLLLSDYCLQPDLHEYRQRPRTGSYLLYRRIFQDVGNFRMQLYYPALDYP